MRQASVYYKEELAGTIIELDNGTYTFKYNDIWLADTQKPAISLTLAKQKAIYTSEYLMPFFYNLLPEGTNKKIICNNLKIDEKDYFSLLIATANKDTIGAIMIQ